MDNINQFGIDELLESNMTIKDLIVPNILRRRGTTINFEFNRLFFEKYKERCLRVSVLYCLALFGASKKSKMYILNYDLSLKRLICFDLDKLLICCFFNVPIKGKIFNISNENIPCNELEPMFMDDILPGRLYNGEKRCGVFKDHEYEDYYEHGRKTKNMTRYMDGIKEVNSHYSTYHTTISQTKADVTDCYQVDYDEDDDPAEYEKYGFHPCMGCDDPQIENEKTKQLNINRQIFDFDKFFLNIEQDNNNEHKYVATINQIYTDSFTHASYISAVRETRNIITETNIENINYVRDVIIEIKENPDNPNTIIVSTKYYGISVF